MPFLHMAGLLGLPWATERLFLGIAQTACGGGQMYEELINRLRTYANDGTDDLRNKAADAIEKLQKDLERSKDFEAFWQYEAEEALKKFQVAIANKPRWIPVTERLPEEEACGCRVLCVLTKKSRGWVWVDDRLFMDGDFWHPKHQKGKVTHWMPLPKPPREET